VIKGDVIAKDTKDCYVQSEYKLITTIGLEHMMIVETDDAILIADKDKVQDIKAVVEEIKAQNRSEHSVHRKVYQPWGYYNSIDYGERFQVKRIVVNPGAQLSLQMHHHRAEHWIVVQGTATVRCGEKTMLLAENQSTYIPLGETHQLSNPGKFPLEIIEVQSGSHLGADDIVRFQDLYGRN
jgi:mannose-1-phosphate guanylyltransferase